MLLTWKDIPGHFDFADLYTEAVERAVDNAHFVEIGTLLGRSACFMGQAIRESGKRIKFDAVDLFRRPIAPSNGEIHALDPQHNPDTSRAVWDLLVTCDDMYSAAKWSIEHTGCSDIVNLIHASGQENASRYRDSSLDFVFIDAEHTYVDTVQLLRLYLPKLKDGGVLAGHDYGGAFPGVVCAVANVLGAVETRGNSFVYRKPHLQI